MLFDIEKDLFLLKELSMNPKQLCLIKVLIPDPRLTERQNQERMYRQNNMMKEAKMIPTHNDLADLVSREIIIDYGKIGSAIQYAELEINPAYMKHLSLKVKGAPTELFDAYPEWFHIQHKRFNAKDGGPVDFALEYLRAIDGDMEEHARILEDLKWAIKNNEVNSGIMKFVKTRRWNAIREIRNNLSSKTFIDVNIG